MTSETPATSQSPTNTNSQRGTGNQGVNNPQTNPNAVPISPESTSPQANQSDQNKPLYERQATDVPWRSHSGSSNTTTTVTTNPNASTTTTTTTPPQQ